VPVAIIDTITTIAEVCLLQSHNMNTLTDLASTRIFPDDNISTIINNVVRFVYGNSEDDLNAYIKLHCINTLSVIALNNVMLESGYLKDVWKYVDPFDKDRFYEMIKTKKASSTDSIDVISTIRGQFHDIEEPI